MTHVPPTTTFVSRGRLAGLVRDEPPAGTGQNRASRGERRGVTPPAVDEALCYRARLILGDSCSDRTGKARCFHQSIPDAPSLFVA
jgi:hypothetical protein